MVTEWKDLPLVFKSHLVSELNLKSRNSLRLCSREDMEIVDICPIPLESLEIVITHGNGINLKIQKTSDFNSRIFRNSLEFVGVLSVFRKPFLKINEFRIMCPGSQSDKLSELISNFETLQPKVKIHARHMYWRCSDSLDRANNIDFIRFLECFDEDVLEMIHNDMNRFTCDEMNQLRALKQWRNAKELSLGNGKVMFVEPFLHFRNCTVYFERLDEEAIWKMIQSFLSRDLPVGCLFDFYNEQPPRLEDVFKAHNVEPKHQPIFPDDNGVEGRHTQRFKMRTEGNFLVVKNTEMGIRGIVQKMEE